MTSSTTPAPQLEFGSAKDQAHLFLWKYPDFESDKVMTLLADFARFTSHGGSNSDYLDEFQTCR